MNELQLIVIALEKAVKFEIFNQLEIITINESINKLQEVLKKNEDKDIETK